MQLGAQALVPDPVIAQIEPLLRAEAPALRGEAALALATTRDSRFYPAILAIAHDQEPAARHRALLALGYLEHPGSDVLLNRILRNAPRDSLDRAVTAMALGLLPEEPRVPAIDEFFARVHASSRKRIRDELSSMLLGMLHRPHPSHRAALQSILDDASYRNRPILVLVLENLAKVPLGLEVATLEKLLRNNNAGIVDASLRALNRPTTRLNAGQRKIILDLAERSKSTVEVRIAALGLLTGRRQPEALDLAHTFLDGEVPELAAAAVRTLLKLGGGALRESLEARILATGDTSLQLAMLGAKSAPHSDDFVKACLALASDKTCETARRIRTGLITAEAGWKEVVPVLVDLFLEADDPATMTDLAQALRALDVDLRKKIYPTKTLADTARLGDRVHALLAAGHKQAPSLLIEILATKTTPQDVKAAIVRAYRLTHLTTLEDRVLALAPAGVRALLKQSAN